jgi:undecaprenyl-diphosphatase
MIYLIAIIQGIVEGLTEFLPISSTGHLILTGHLLGFTDDRAKTFEIVIQLAAILAVVTLYFHRFLRFIPTSKNNKLKGFNGIHALKTLLITTLPAVIAGFVLHDFVKDKLFTPMTVALGLFVGGIILIIFERFVPKPKSKSLEEITNKQALGIGLAQIFSIWPGVSRAASTIVGGSFLKLDRSTAVEYSFFAAVPVMVGATALDLAKNIDVLKSSDIPLFILGLVSSYVTAILAITYFLKFVKNHSLAIFGYYRIVLAIIVLLVLVL